MTSESPKPHIRLQDRDLEILEFINRYRLATRELIHQRFFSDSELNAATKVTSRLTDARYLARHPFISTSTYFTLGKKGAKHFGAPYRVCEALGVQSLLIQYGILDYCCAPETSRLRLRVSEVLAKKPSLHQKGLDSSNYVADNSSEALVFQFVRVDGGGTTEHIASKLQESISKRVTNPVFKTLMDHARFEVVCVTYSDERVARIDAKLAKEKLPCKVKFHCSNTLLNLLPSTLP